MSRDDPAHGGWHPLMATREVEPGVWVMVDPYNRPYGLIRLVRRGGELGYRCERRLHDDSTKLVGYYRTLRTAAYVIHRAFVADHAASSDLPVDVPDRWAIPAGPPIGPMHAAASEVERD
jgi:hypothetical protein